MRNLGTNQKVKSCLTAILQKITSCNRIAAVVVIPSLDEERKELPTFKWWEIENQDNHPIQIYRKSMQKVVCAVGEEVEVAHNLLVLLLSKFQVRLRVAHL